MIIQMTITMLSQSQYHFIAPYIIEEKINGQVTGKVDEVVAAEIAEIINGYSEKRMPGVKIPWH